MNVTPGGSAAPAGPRTARGLVVFLNEGGGRWIHETLSSTTDGLFGDHVEAADVDGDGRADILASSNVMGLSTLLARQGHADEGLEALPVRSMAYVRALAAVDLDGDGDLDLAAAIQSFEPRSWLTGIDGYFRSADGTWERRPLWFEEGKRGIFALDGGDLDGDGRPDLVALTGDGEVLVFVGRGAGRFALQDGKLLESAAGCRGYQVAVTDLDKDGRGDLVVNLAGEHAGLAGLLEQPGCPGLGSLRAWRSQATPPGG
jgi:hypothetical protein